LKNRLRPPEILEKGCERKRTEIGGEKQNSGENSLEKPKNRSHTVDSAKDPCLRLGKKLGRHGDAQTSQWKGTTVIREYLLGKGEGEGVRSGEEDFVIRHYHLKVTVIDLSEEAKRKKGQWRG